jgi:hypothetical protein
MSAREVEAAEARLALDRLVQTGADAATAESFVFPSAAPALAAG